MLASNILLQSFILKKNNVSVCNDIVVFGGINKGQTLGNSLRIIFRGDRVGIYEQCEGILGA